MAEEDEFMAAVNKMADAMGLKDDARDEYIEQHATKHGGYRKVTSWIKDDKSGKGGTQNKAGWWTSGE